MSTQPEKKIENEILKYLKDLSCQKGSVVAIKLQHVGIFNPILKRFMKSKNPLHKTSEGLADIVVHLCENIDEIKCVRTFYLEVKTKTGKISESQKKFKSMVTDAGIAYYVVRSVEDVRKIIDKSLLIA